MMPIFPIKTLYSAYRSAVLQHLKYCHTSESALPLQGIRVLDFTRILAGPFCTMLLGDLGAQVIKVERLGTGDDTRTWGPPFVNSESTYFLSVNRNKKSVALDMKSKDGKQIIQQLALKSDIVVENFVPGTLDRLGLGYKDLSASNKRLIYCSITGFGSTGPYAHRAGYDVIASGIGGLMHITGSKVSLLTHIASNYLNANMEASRIGSAHASIVPYQAFQTADGWLVVGAGNDKLFTSLCKNIEHPELASDSRFCNNESRVSNRKELIEVLTEIFSTQKTDHWLQVLEGSGIAYGPINDIPQVFKDPQMLHMESFQTIQHPIAGDIKLLSPAVRFSSFNQNKMEPPPLLGEHTVSILQDILNYDQEKIKNLQDSGCIGCT